MRQLVAGAAISLLLSAIPSGAQTCVTTPSGLLYPSWLRPPAVQMDGEAVAASLQLDADGEIKAMPIGMSTAGQMFGGWDRDGVVPTLRWIDGTLGGGTAELWETPGSNGWVYLTTMGVLTNESVRTQIQVLFVQTVQRRSDTDPDQSLWKARTLNIIDAARQVLPALQMVYVVPMVGTIAQSRVMGEPWNHAQSLRAAEIEAEWTDPTLWVGTLSSLWSDRTEPNPDGHAWTCADWQGDLIHYTAQGSLKAGDYFGAKVEADSTTRPWMFDAPAPPAALYLVDIDGAQVVVPWGGVFSLLDPGADLQSIAKQ